MFQSKMTVRSNWSEMTSINSSSAPGFIPIPCPSHQQYSITNICKAANCIEPLCPECIASHVQLHQQTKKPAKIENIITTRTTCIEQLAVMKYEAQKEIEEATASSAANIEQFVQAHQKKLETAYKKIIKIVDDLFSEMNRQMQVISSAYLGEKDKRQKQIRSKLSPLYSHLQKVTQYKQELQSEDYIPALIELLNEPPRKPKYQPLADTKNYGSVQINQKYLDDLKQNITNFVKVVVNCKQDEGLRGRIEMNRSSFNGSNNMKFSRFDRSRSRENGESRIADSRRSNSKKKIFGCESVVSDIRPVTGSSSRIDMDNNSIYRGLQANNFSKNVPVGQTKLSQVRYTSYSTPMKVSKIGYFNSHKCALWYFKEGSRNGFRASLDSIEAGFQRLDLSISFTIPEGHSTVVAPAGWVYLIGGEQPQDRRSLSSVYRLDQNTLALKEMSPMQFPRSNFGACYHQQHIYVAGGISSESNRFSTKSATAQVQRYTLRQNRWQRLASLPEAAFGFTMHPISNSRIVKFGGVTDNRVFVSKLDVYDLYSNAWVSVQPDNRFVFCVNAGVTQISNDSLVIFGGCKSGNKNDKTSLCYILSEEEGGATLAITEGPQLYNDASFENAYIHEGAILAIQNNQNSARNKLIMGYRHEQWKFISC